MSTLVIVLAVVALAALLFLGWWSQLLARRLDRLHVRTDAAWAALDAALSRRAVVARAIARWSTAGDGALARLAEIADLAEVAPASDRETVENELTRMLAAQSSSGLAEGLAAELADTQQRVILARRMYNDVVRDTRALRRHRLVRWFRLGGTAPNPRYFEIVEPSEDG